MKGTGPKGTVTQAATAIRAMDRPQNATLRARAAEGCVIAFDMMGISFHSVYLPHSLCGNEGSIARRRRL